MTTSYGDHPTAPATSAYVADDSVYAWMQALPPDRFVSGGSKVADIRLSVTVGEVLTLAQTVATSTAAS